MTAMTDSAPTIYAKDLVAHPRAVSKIIMEAVNKHGVPYRIQDGTHIRLYCGDRNVVPLKISAVRPAEYTIRYLIPWLEQHVPSWLDKAVTEDAIETLASVVNTQTREPKPKPPPKALDKKTAVEDLRFEGDHDPALPFPDEEWKPFKYGFETDGNTYRCTVEGCDYTKDNARSIHLHQSQKHGDREALSEVGFKAAATLKLRKEQAKVLRREAVRVLAEQNGLVVFEKGDMSDSKKVTKLETEITSLRAERDDLKARLDLLKEAMNA